jgi:endonuclease/exonuclease/phosphatase family metal-dependent hydrolase
VVVRGDNANSTDIKSAAQLRVAINTAASLEIAIKTDSYTKEDSSDLKEILVGKTSRKTSFDRTTLKEGDYYIGIEGNRIIVDAYDSLTLRFAVGEFAEKWLKAGSGIQEDGVLLMNETICNSLNGITVYPENTITVLSQNMFYSEENRAARMVRFQKLIEEYSPDLIGTQETTKKWLNDFKSKLTDYGVVGCSRDGRNSNSGEWSAILYKLDRFSLIQSDTFWLSDTPGTTSRYQDSLCNRICTWALLKDKQTGENILMANTHLDHGTDAVRDKQAAVLIGQLRNKFPDYPIFITGDFNCEPASSTYKLITKKWNDAHDDAIIDKSTIQNTFSTSNPVKEIDFCFYGGDVFPITYYIMNEKVDGGYVSDHFGVIAEFAYK